MVGYEKIGCVVLKHFETTGRKSVGAFFQYFSYGGINKIYLKIPQGMGVKHEVFPVSCIIRGKRKSHHGRKHWVVYNLADCGIGFCIVKGPD